MIDRRAFLRRLGFGTVAVAAASIAAFDIEKLLWVPNEKKIFVSATATAPAIAVDKEIGIAIRFIREFDLLYSQGYLLR